ncbi:hypothetical protein D3C76_846170 [compost metagenome]
MNVSVHQIRYFEEKGVLIPAFIDNSQYRMYSIDQVYQLARNLRGIFRGGRNRFWENT